MLYRQETVALSSSRVSFTFLLGLLSLLPLMCLLSPHYLLYCLYLSILLIMKLSNNSKIILRQVKNPQIHNNVVHIGKRLELKM